MSIHGAPVYPRVLLCLWFVEVPWKAWKAESPPLLLVDATSVCIMAAGDRAVLTVHAAVELAAGSTVAADPSGPAQTLHVSKTGSVDHSSTVIVVSGESTSAREADVSYSGSSQLVFSDSAVVVISGER